MTPTECVRLVRFIAARSPAMRMQDDTAEAWYIDLVNYDITDAIEAARIATLDKTFIGIGDLVHECQTIVNRRAGIERRAVLDQQVDAENPPTAAVTEKTRPLAALMAGTPVKPVPRGGYDGPTRRLRDNARLEQAKAELDEARRLARAATPGGTTPERSEIEPTPEAM